MNSVSKHGTIILIDKTQKALLKKDLEKFKKPAASDRAVRVSLVEKKWFDAFVSWLESSNSPPPGKMRTDALFHKSKFNTSCRYHVDYEIIESGMWEKLTELFGRPPQIVKHYVLHPKTREPTILINPINLHIDIGERTIYKATAEDWEIGDVRDQLCNSLGFKAKDYEFCKPMRSTSPIPDRMTVGYIQKNYPGTLILHKKEIVLTSILSKYANYGLPRPLDIEHVSNIDSDYDSDSYSEISTPPSLRRPVTIYKQNYNTKILRPAAEPPSKMHNASSALGHVSSSLSPKPCGLRNLGNTCFFNAAVQCLVRCQPLTNFILSSKCEAQINRKNPLGTKGKIVTAYRNLLEEMVGASGRLSVLNPSKLHSAIANQYPIFESFGQNDSQELVGALLDGLHEDLNQSSHAKGNCAPVYIPKDADSWQLHLAKNSSPILDLFHGTLFHSIECPRCHNETTVRDPFVFLSLPVPNSYYSHIKLADCISSFSQSETLDAHNLWKCDHCHKEVQAANKIGIHKTSDILIIHLKRFHGQSYFMKKIDTPVDYPDTLDSYSFSQNGANKVYNLIGVVFHHGSLIGGHYTSAAIDPQTGKWYEFNDSMVTPIHRSDAHSSAAYILFYQKS